ARPVSPSITLTPAQRATLLRYYRGPFAPQLCLRAHILLLLHDGRPWDDIAGAPKRLGGGWAAVVVTWVLQATPRAFGFLRSRWCCEVLALLLGRRHRLEVSRETVRRWLRQADLVWRRPRPVLRRRDPRREQIVAGLRDLLVNLPDDETAVFEDEVDV